MTVFQYSSRHSSGVPVYGVEEAADAVDEVGPVFEGRPLALRDDLARQPRADALDGFELGGAGGPVVIGAPRTPRFSTARR